MLMKKQNNARFDVSLLVTLKPLFAVFRDFVMVSSGQFPAVCSCHFCASSWSKHKWLFVFATPGFIDVVAVALTSTALIYMSASVYATMRGAVIIMSGILSMIFLKRKLVLYHWIAIAITVSGLVVMGTRYIAVCVYD